MVIIYRWCGASAEGDPAGFVVATDAIAELTAQDYEGLEPTECVWFIPGTECNQ